MAESTVSKPSPTKADNVVLTAAPAVTPEPAGQAQSSRSLPALIEAAVSKGVRVLLTKSGYEIEGFYKAGSIRLDPDATGFMVATDKKEKQTLLKTFDDLVKLNYEWWKKSREKSTEFVNPGKEWIDEFVRLNYVKRQVIFIPGED